MTETTNVRRERIERLLHDLHYEIERGMLEGEIEETIRFSFYVPLSHVIPDGVVFCEFRTRPVMRLAVDPNDTQPRLRVVK